MKSIYNDEELNKFASPKVQETVQKYRTAEQSLSWLMAEKPPKNITVSFGNRTSRPEQALIFFLEKIFQNVNADIEIKQRDRTELGGRELDIFIPRLRIAFEYDGYRWHCDKVDKDVEKNKLCQAQGIQIFRIGDTPEDISIRPVDQTGTKDPYALSKISHGAKSVLYNIDDHSDTLCDNFKRALREFFKMVAQAIYENENITPVSFREEIARSFRTTKIEFNPWEMIEIEKRWNQFQHGFSSRSVVCLDDLDEHGYPKVYNSAQEAASAYNITGGARLIRGICSGSDTRKVQNLHFAYCFCTEEEVQDLYGATDSGLPFVYIEEEHKLMGSYGNIGAPQEKIVELEQTDEEYVVKKEYNTISEAGSELGINDSNISGVLYDKKSSSKLFAFSVANRFVYQLMFGGFDEERLPFVYIKNENVLNKEGLKLSEGTERWIINTETGLAFLNASKTSEDLGYKGNTLYTACMEHHRVDGLHWEFLDATKKYNKPVKMCVTDWEREKGMEVIRSKFSLECIVHKPTGILFKNYPEAAECIGRSRKTIREWINKGECGFEFCSVYKNDPSIRLYSDIADKDVARDLILKDINNYRFKEQLPECKNIIDLHTGVVYENCAEAGRAVGRDRSTIIEHLHTPGDEHWAYYNPQETYEGLTPTPYGEHTF